MERESEMKRMHAIARGRVQGVCFRMYVRDQAEALGVRGWVRNCPDGSVETVAEAAPETLADFAERLRSGSPWSRVESLTREERNPTGEFDSFTIRYG